MYISSNGVIGVVEVVEVRRGVSSNGVIVVREVSEVRGIVQ